MALINKTKREVNVKVVYTGLPRAGKTTNLSVIYQRLKPEFRGQERSIPMGGCVMQLCEFQLPGAGAIPGFVTRYHLYTLAGSEIGAEQWRMVLKGADGIVFVMDTDPNRTAANREAFTGLLGQLNSLGVDLSQLPIVVQANCQLESTQFDEAEVLRQLAMPGLSALAANASKGEGVLETLTTVVRKINTILQRIEMSPLDDADDPDHDDLDERAEESVPAVPADESSAADLPVAGNAVELPALQVPTTLTPDGGVLEVPVRLLVAGIEKEFVLSISLREAGVVACEPLRGAAYVR